MEFIETDLAGAFIIKFELRKDERGFFTRTFCENEFNKMGLVSHFVQNNWSQSVKKNTLRGMHFQINDSKEVKIVRCTRGSMLDVIIDLRPKSATYCKHIKVVLAENSFTSLYVPRGFAHGFLTLEDNTEVFYQVSGFYSPQNERGVRWNDPCFKIDWGAAQPVISDKDSQHMNFDPTKNEYFN